MPDAIHIQIDAFSAWIYLDRLSDMRFTNTRRLFRLLLDHAWCNENAVRSLDRFLPETASKSESDWQTASSGGYVVAAKKAKARYERWVKIHALWNDTKHKMNVK